MSVCLSVCLLATLSKNYGTDLSENFTIDVTMDKEEMVKFQKSSAFVSRSRNCLMDSSTLQDGSFPTVWLMWKKLI